jgi:nicotinamidase-related amidase
MKALVIADMLVDFVDGELANPRAREIVEPIRRLRAHARASGWVVAYVNDAHLPDDPELHIWGEHAMAGTPGAQVIAALAPEEGELVVPKRAYGGFDGTDLDERLRSRGIDEVVLTGQHAHICVRHTAYGALVRGYEITVPRDAVTAFEDVDLDDAFAYLKMAYGARLTAVEELAGAPAAVEA